MRTAIALLSMFLFAPAALGQPATGKPRAPALAREAEVAAPEIAAAIRSRLDSILKVVDDGGKFDKAAAELESLFDQTLAYAPDELGLVVDVGAARRLMMQLDRCEEAPTRELLAYLRANPELGRVLVYLVQPEDKLDAVYGVLETLRAAHGEAVARYPALASAICVVHDEPIPLAAPAPGGSRYADPAALFAYFAGNDGRLAFAMNEMPAEILVHLVDSRAAIGEMQWALGKHRGDRAVGKRYDDLVYDTMHFKFNQPKKISEHPYTLQNLARCGGICGDQAYYAAHIAKSIGVPSASIAGQRADIGHAWVGFLQKRGGTFWFNCEEGHYDEYEKVRGGTTDPQTGQGMSQSQFELLAMLMATPAPSRHAALALVDGAIKLRRAQAADRTWPPPPPVAGAKPVAAANDAPFQTALVRRASELSPGEPDVWLAAIEWGPVFTMGDRQRWFEAVHERCRTTEPDFAFVITANLIRGIKDTPAQLNAWEWLAKRHNRRPDLAGSAMYQRGECLLESGDKNGAYDAFREVAKKYINEGPFAIGAVDRAADMLREFGRPEMVPELYGDIFRGASRPEQISGGSMRASNYYKVGVKYAEALEAAGRTRDAQRIVKQMQRMTERD